ncbi:MAG: hypothetical protein V1926_02195 [Candidatus Peregrinibacteria bacterium]
MRRSARIAAFVETIWGWYAVHKRSLPWRDMPIVDANERAYRVLVSEVMLQQTHVSRVKIIFPDFLRRFPSLLSLAEASNRDVLIAWRSLGYNNRALRLRDAARQIVGKIQDPLRLRSSLRPSGFARQAGQARSKDEDEGRGVQRYFLDTMEELTAIPGIGSYTAAAIMNFAFNIPTPCLDTNIRRILHRTFFGPENVDGTFRVSDGRLLVIASEVLATAIRVSKYKNQISSIQPKTNPSAALRVNDRRGLPASFPPSVQACEMGRRGGKGVRRDAANWHAALMDFGSLIQTKKNPKWDECPLTRNGIMETTRRSFCRSTRTPPSPGGQEGGEERGVGGVRKEPGRLISGRFVPNRIIRGRIVEHLRDCASGLSMGEIGKRVCSDWFGKRHRKWLRGIVGKLIKDRLLVQKGKYILLS